MNIEKRIAQNCLACGWKGGIRFVSRHDGEYFMRCERCHSLYLENIPLVVTGLYIDDYFALSQRGAEKNQEERIGYERSYNVSYRDLDFYWAFRISDLIAKSVQDSKENKRCLDVGAANGRLLNQFKYAGYETHGIELSSTARVIAESFGHKMYGQPIESIQLNGDKYEIVTALEVIEHLENLPEFFGRICRLMSSDGVFFGYFPSAHKEWFGATESYHWLHNSLEHLVYPTEKGIRLATAESFGSNVFTTTFLTKSSGDVIPFTLLVAFKSTPTGEGKMLVEELFRQLNHINNKSVCLPEDIWDTWKVAAENKPSMLDLPFVIGLLCSKFGLAYVANDFISAIETHALTDDQVLDLLVMAMHQGRIHFIRKQLIRNAHRDLPSKLILEFHQLVLAFESTERDAATTERDAAVRERDAATTERDATVRELYNVYRSTSWRITKPIRHLASKVKSYTKLSQLLLYNRGDVFTWNNVIKGLKLLEKGDVSGLKTSLKRVASEIQKQDGRAIEPEFVSSCPLSPGQPLVSVVIPCFNYGKYVTDAVNSILAQTLKNVEVIVIDGGSTDSATLKILSTMQLPRTTVLFREGRHLVGDNRNFGIEKAQGRYICCLDADDMLEPTYLEKAVFYLETYGYDVVSTAINFIGARKGRIDILAYPDLNDMVSGNHVLTCAVFRKRLWNEAGGFFDVGVGKHHVAEDWDFWLRLAAKGARIRNISGEYLFNYRIHSGGSLSSCSDVKSLPDQRAAILNRNRQLLTSKAFDISRQRQAKYLWCNPSYTAVASGLNTASHLRKKTLLLTMPFFMIGGAERLLSGLCRYLANNNWRIIVVSTLEHDAILGNSIDWFRESTSELYELTRFLEPRERNDFILYLLSSRKPDCVLNTGSRLLYELLPSIAAGGNDLCIIDLLFNTVGHVESHLEFRKFITFALAENHEVYNWLLSEAKWPADRVRLVSSGIDLQSLRPADRPNDLVAKYGITENELVIGFSGRLSEEKAPDYFVEIAKLCLDTPNLRFVMTGTGPMSSTIEKQIKMLPSTVKFEFAGLVEDVTKYFALYDALILPSRFDGRPLVVMETLACGVPVIASNVGALPDMIEDGVNGYLVENGNLNKFAEKIRTINKERVLLKRLKSGARRTAEEKLDSNKAYFNYECFIKEALTIHTNAKNRSC